jgi:hypothetical protein
METKWGHIRDMIAGQLERIDSVGYDIFPPSKSRTEFDRMLKKEYEANLEKTLDAVDFLIRTGHWPEMSAKVLFFMKPRVMFAWKITASLSTPLLGEPLPTFTAELEHHLAWALDDIWITVGFELWLIEEGNKFELELNALHQGLKEHALL